MVLYQGLTFRRFIDIFAVNTVEQSSSNGADRERQYRTLLESSTSIGGGGTEPSAGKGNNNMNGDAVDVDDETVQVMDVTGDERAMVAELSDQIKSAVSSVGRPKNVGKFVVNLDWQD